MRFFYYLYCISFFSLCVVCSVLVDLYDFVVLCFSSVRAFMRKFGKRFYWAFIHAARHFDKLGR